MKRRSDAPRGVDAAVDVWEGMTHGFVGSVGGLEAAHASLQIIGRFLAERLTAGWSDRGERAAHRVGIEDDEVERPIRGGDDVAGAAGATG